MTCISEPYHVLQCKPGHALEAAIPTYVEYKAAVHWQRPLYNAAR